MAKTYYLFKDLINDLNSYSKIGIWGFGKEGQSVYNFLNRYLDKEIIIFNDKKIDGYNINLELDFNKVDIVFKSPGISCYKNNISYLDKFTSMTEMFIKHYKNNIIAVTGTKGKSTTSSLIYNLLKNIFDTKLLGNIGYPIFDEIENITDDTKIVLELSSFQLYNIKYYPKIGILLNLYEEHLDYYFSKEEYFNSKKNILKSDIIITPNDIKNLQLDFCKDFYKKNYTFIHCDNIKTLYLIKNIFNIDDDIFFKTINNFKSLPHRLEFVGEINGIFYINDSISTIPQTTISAINAIGINNIDTIILGGYDRGVNLDILIDFLNKNNIRQVLLFSQTGKKLTNIKNSIYFDNFKDMINFAKNNTKKGKFVLFSPGASSFGDFKNFEDRGNQFKDLIIL